MCVCVIPHHPVCLSIPMPVFGSTRFGDPTGVASLSATALPRAALARVGSTPPSGAVTTGPRRPLTLLAPNWSPKIRCDEVVETPKVLRFLNMIGPDGMNNSREIKSNREKLWKTTAFCQGFRRVCPKIGIRRSLIKCECKWMQIERERETQM